MPTAITFEFFGEPQLSRTLARMTEAVDDLRPVWEALADRFASLEGRQFATEGRYGSGGWAPLSPRYAAWKARHYPGKTILRRTDDLYRSLTERPLGVEVIEPRFAIFGTAVEYGQYHQHGTAHMPRRRPVEFPESERREWVKVLQRFLVTGEVPSVGPRGGIRYGPPT
jgi:phage gpG-like protein